MTTRIIPITNRDANFLKGYLTTRRAASCVSERAVDGHAPIGFADAVALGVIGVGIAAGPKAQLLSFKPT